MGGSLLSEGLLLSGFIRDHNFFVLLSWSHYFFLGGGDGGVLPFCSLQYIQLFSLHVLHMLVD